ncbi:MAG: cytochrome c biogenesis protein CcsA, partial [Armatimonadetes bacterium]|nr:cytochrome c biogenesis protein CcsA [Armatimonadota bacterium]
MPQVGLYSVLAGAVSAWAGAALALWRPKSARLLRGAQALTAAFCAAGFFILMVLVARADARVVYAVEHAAPKDAALGYRLAAVWAGQAGGLLLWAFEAAVVALFLRPAAMPRAVGVLLAIEGCLLGMVAMDNPFGPPRPGATGGMNPMLLHPMMLIHPPMLFLGYALLAVPYAVTVGALLDRRPDTWPQQVRPWVLVGWLALTAGNGFGAEWAYKTFGWGGFWAWDPVENTSFVPWVLAAVTVHCLWLAQRDDRWLPPAAVTAMASFLTVLYGSYLARSGALAGASVHAYVAGERLMQYALLTVLLGAAAVGASVMVARWGSWRKWTLYEVVSAAGVPVWETFPVASDSAAVEGAGGTASVSRGAPGGRESDAREASGEEEAYGATREVATGWCVGAMAVIAALVLAGMSLPMAGLSPSPTLYNTVLLPVAVAIVALMTRMAAPRLTDRARSWLLAIAAFVSVGGIAMAVQYGAGLERGWLMAVQALCAPVLVVFCALAMLWSCLLYTS